jgi:hypothetical protein
MNSCVKLHDMVQFKYQLHPLHLHHSLHQMFRISGRDPRKGRGVSDVGSREGFMENSIIIKNVKTSIYIQIE